jgi:RNA polymerase sigma factor (sigma-70 family)
VASLNAFGMEDVSTDLDGYAVSGAGLGTEYDLADGPPLAGRYRQRDARDLWAAVEDTEESGDVRRVIASLSATQRETFRLLYVERLTEREAAAELGVTQQAVHNRAVKLRDAVERALVGVVESA